MPPACEADLRRTLGPGGLARLAYRLGHDAASGVLTLAVRPAPAGARAEVVVLRRGAAVSGDGELARRALKTRLARAAGAAALAVQFDAGVPACPPGALHQVPLAAWARGHLEAQLDGALAERLVRELAGARLALHAELAPAPDDEADRRMIAALADTTSPRSLDQLWQLARTPRYRLLAFIHFLRGVGALRIEPLSGRTTAQRPAAGPRSPASPPRAAGDPRAAAMQLLGIDDASDADAVKRAYRRLARTLHPDLQPGADLAQRRSLERRFAELTAAYEALSD